MYFNICTREYNHTKNVSTCANCLLPIVDVATKNDGAYFINFSILLFKK